MINFPQHQQLIDSTAAKPAGGPNDLLKFLFETPEFLTSYQKDVVRAWMANPAQGEALKQEGPGGAAPAGQASPANPIAPAGQPGGQPAAAQAPAGPKPAVGAPKPV